MLDPHELAYLAAWGNRPLGVAHVWTWIVQESGMHPQLQVGGDCSRGTEAARQQRV